MVIRGKREPYAHWDKNFSFSNQAWCAGCLKKGLAMTVVYETAEPAVRPGDPGKQYGWYCDECIGKVTW